MSLTPLYLFGATFALVFFLGVQQLVVNANEQALAFVLSMAISSANLVLYKLVPGPTSIADLAGYTLGGACGIVAGMRVYAAVRRRRPASAMQTTNTQHEHHVNTTRCELSPALMPLALLFGIALGAIVAWLIP